MPEALKIHAPRKLQASRAIPGGGRQLLSESRIGSCIPHVQSVTKAIGPLGQVVLDVVNHSLLEIGVVEDIEGLNLEFQVHFFA